MGKMINGGGAKQFFFSNKRSALDLSESTEKFITINLFRVQRLFNIFFSVNWELNDDDDEPKHLGH